MAKSTANTETGICAGAGSAEGDAAAEAGAALRPGRFPRPAANSPRTVSLSHVPCGPATWSAPVAENAVRRAGVPAARCLRWQDRLRARKPVARIPSPASRKAGAATRHEAEPGPSPSPGHRTGAAVSFQAVRAFAPRGERSSEQRYEPGRPAHPP